MAAAPAASDLRPYQEACLAAAKERNLLAVLPTNSGKTRVAAHLAGHYLSRGNGRKIVFLAPTGPLVEQQAQVLASHLGTLLWNSPEQEEGGPPRLRLHHGKLEQGDGISVGFWSSAEVFVLTPHFLLQSLVHGDVRLELVALLVLDEAHHSTGKELCGILMRHFYPCCDAAVRPRILGLTASPFKGNAREPEALRNDLLDMERLLDSQVWTSNECCPTVAELKIEEYEVADSPSPAAMSFLGLFKELISMDWADGDVAAKAYARMEALVRGDASTQAMGAWAGAEALQLNVECLLSDDVEQSHAANSNGLAPPRGGGKAQACWGQLCGHLQPWMEQHSPLGNEAGRNLVVLRDMLRARNGPGMRALIFVRTRLRAVLVHRFLEGDPELRGFSKPIVSSRPGSTLQPGLSSSRQRAALQSFREDADVSSDALRILVSTPVLEEGIDVPNCSLVVRFDPPQTPIENIQSRGRARHEDSEYIHLVAKGDTWHRELLRDFANHETALRSLFSNMATRSADRAGALTVSPGEVFTVGSTGALLPPELAIDFVRRIYTFCESDDDVPVHFSLPAFCTNDKEAARSNYKFSQTAPGKGRFSLRLPAVGGSNLLLQQEALVHGEELPKSLAKQSAALAGVRKLHELGALNDNLRVPGRAERMAEVRQVSQGKLPCGRCHRPDDFLAMQQKKDHVRRLPRCMRAPDGLLTEIWLHSVHTGGEQQELGLLLPASVGGPLTFELLLHGEPLSCSVHPQAAQLHISEGQLHQVAHWTACVMGIACVQKVLASSACPLNRRQQVPAIRHALGTYGSEEWRSTPTTTTERAWFALVPLTPDGAVVDWDLLNWGRQSMEIVDFQMVTASNEQSFAGRQLQLCDAVLLHANREQKGRMQLFCKASLVESESGVLLEATAVHRGVENNVSAKAKCKHPIDEQALRFSPEHCKLLPLTLSQLMLLKQLPGILWRLEHLALVREEQAAFPGASLQNLAEAWTHTVACAPAVRSGTGPRPTLPPGMPLRALQCDCERLEFLGDAVLKCLACTWAFGVYKEAAEGKLSSEAQKLQTNKFLRRCLLKQGWETGMLAKAFGPKTPLDELRRQEVSHKQEADIVEALLGAVFCQAEQPPKKPGIFGSPDAATAFFVKYLLPHQDHTSSASCYSALLLSGSEVTGCTRAFRSYFEELQREGEQEKSVKFQRLEFLGDAALQLLVTQHLVGSFPDDLSEGELSELRAALVCNRYLAKKLIRQLESEVRAQRFHGGFKPELRENIRLFTERVLQSPVHEDFVVRHNLGISAYALGASVGQAVQTVEGPKCVADMYEAIVGAMLLDCGGNLARVWAVIEKDFQVSLDAARRGLQAWRMAEQRMICSPAACVVVPDASKKEAARREWPAKLERQRQALEQKRLEEWRLKKDLGLEGAALEAALQEDPVFAGLDVQKWLQAPRQPGSSPGVQGGAAEASAAPDEGSRAQGEGCVTTPPHFSSSSPDASSSSSIATGSYLGTVRFERGADGSVHAALTVRLLPGADCRNFHGAGGSEEEALSAASQEAIPWVLSNTRVQPVSAGAAPSSSTACTPSAAYREGATSASGDGEAIRPDSAGFHRVVCSILAAAGAEGLPLVSLGNTQEVIQARGTFHIPAKHKLRRLVEERPDLYALSGEGAQATVRLL